MFRSLLRRTKRKSTRKPKTVSPASSQGSSRTVNTPSATNRRRTTRVSSSTSTSSKARSNTSNARKSPAKSPGVNYTNQYNNDNLIMVHFNNHSTLRQLYNNTFRNAYLKEPVVNLLVMNIYKPTLHGASPRVKKIQKELLQKLATKKMSDKSRAYVRAAIRNVYT